MASVAKISFSQIKFTRPPQNKSQLEQWTTPSAINSVAQLRADFMFQTCWCAVPIYLTVRCAGSIECMSLACYSYTCDGRFSLLSILCTQCSPFKESESHIVERKNELHSQLQCYTFICNTSTRTHTTNIANNKKLSQNGKQQQLQKNVLE